MVKLLRQATNEYPPVPLPPALVDVSFPDFRKALTLHMVETSEDLKASQVKKLGATFAATASYSASRGGGGGGGAREVVGSAMQLPGGGQVMWHPKLDQVNRISLSLVARTRSRDFVRFFVCLFFVAYFLRLGTVRTRRKV